MKYLLIFLAFIISMNSRADLSISFANEQLQCQSILDKVFPNGKMDTSKIIQDRKNVILGTGPFSYFETDINNDGQNNLIYVYFDYTHYRRGNVYFVMPSENSAKTFVKDLGERFYPKDKSFVGDYSEYSKELLDYLIVNSSYIYPHVWHSKNWKDIDSGSLSTKAMEKSKIAGSFNFRYTQMTPFTFENQIYVTFTSGQSNKEGVLGIFQSSANHELKEICYFFRNKNDT